MKVRQTLLSYPEIDMHLGDTPRLRGYFGNKYSSKTDMHNHIDDKFIYGYPCIQYKIIYGAPTIVGVNDGAELALNIGIQDHSLMIDGVNTSLGRAEIISDYVDFGVTKESHSYEFITPWIALNQQNTDAYSRISDAIERDELMEKILVGNLISMSKGFGYDVTDKIRARASVEPVDIALKGIRMLGFVGEFKTNFIIPEYLGIGRSVSRGFGCVQHKS